MRAWAYLQLCKNYGTVPFYTDPLVSIGDANSVTDQKDLQGICEALTPELIKFSGTPVPTYGNISAGVLNSSESDNPVEKTIASRYAMIPIDVVIGDLFLETNQYEQAAKYYFNYLRTNKWQIRQAYINPSSYIELLGDKLPTSLNFSVNSNGFSWAGIFSTTSTSDIVTYIPLAANRLRGVVTDLPRIFGYDFYSTTGGGASSDARYLLERQIDASAAYIALSDRQDYYYTPAGQTGAETEVRIAEIGDLRRLASMRQVTTSATAAQAAQTYAVLTKFSSANIPIYRTATVYLRLAEAINRMGYPDAAFAILKDGINEDLTTYVMQGDSTDLIVPGRYIKPATYQLLRTTIPFLSDENKENFAMNWGIHSRGTYYTQGAFSPYQMDSIVGKKMAEIPNLTPHPSLADTIIAVEDIICDEMALELAFEGCRFGDLTRIARHKNADSTYGPNFGSQWLAAKLAYKNPQVSLLDEKNWYLPMK